MNQLRSNSRRRRVRYDRIILITILAAAVICLVVLIIKGPSSIKPLIDEVKGSSGDTKKSDKTNSESTVTPDVQESDKTESTLEAPPADFTAEAVTGTRLSDFGMTYEIEVDGRTVDNYTTDTPFNFGASSDYTDLEGIISFRGNNFRNGGSYGKIGRLDIQYNSDGSAVWGNILKDEWHVPTYSMRKGAGGSYSGSWTGSGWTGQPIIVKWDKETRQHMNMFDWAKEKDELVEVIYATMDGCIYFMDLNGEATRNKLTFQFPFKGAGSLDPRGYPILYLGAGDSYDRSGDFRPAKAMAVSLIDGKVLYEFGQKPDSFAAYRSWTAYDSSALVCAENDSLVYPGENGVLYVIKLNTSYDKTTGSLSMDPSRVIKLRYSSVKNRERGFEVGYEGSAAAYKNYVFLTENSGLMHCVDLNTMSVVWAQDISDDTNSSPVFSVENGKCYLYIGNTVDKTVKDGKGITSFYKIDAATGKIVWQIDREIYTDNHITGGVMTSAVIGENNMKGRAFIVFASYHASHGSYGRLVCINTDDGNIIWEGPLSTYAWSSPVAVYDDEGNGYIVQCNCGGNVYLIDGQSPTYESAIIDKLTITPETNIEATPAVYDDMIVIGTRVSGIHGIRIQSSK